MAACVPRIVGSAIERKASPCCHLEVEHGLPSPAAVALAEDAIHRAAQIEGELDLHL